MRLMSMTNPINALRTDRVAHCLLRGSGLAILVMVLFIGGPVQAGEKHEENGRSRFFGAYLMPRLSRQMEAVPAIHAVPGGGAELADFALLEHVTDAARHRAERGVKKALKSYLLEATSVRKAVLALRGDRRTDSANSRAAVDLGLAVSHGAARLEVRRRSKAGGFALGLDTRGGFGLEFDRSALTKLRLFMGYDARDRKYDFACRFEF